MRSLLALSLVAVWPAFAAAADEPKVKLVVHVVFDQLRGDFIDKWQPHFGEGGFKRLQSKGAWFTDCHYPYAITTTGPGHAAMLTGASPRRTGIINNEWYDRAAAANVNCATSDRYQLIPAELPEKVDPLATPIKPKSPGNPDRLLSPTLGDVLKAAVKPGRVFGLSLKDRSAIFPTGHKQDGAYWFDGRFVTSTYFRETPHAWVEEFNKSKRADAWFGKSWTKSRPTLDYDAIAGPDDGTGEGKGVVQGVKFPHRIDGGLKVAGKKYFEALANSPFGNELLLDFAKACIDAEKLGQDDAPDLLTISFSSNDLIGHAWGPDSQEVFDTTLRSDAIVENLLKYLDEKVGAGQYAVMLTADHGICPLPEFATKERKPGRRLSAVALVAGCEKHLRDTFGDIAKPKDDAEPKVAPRYLEAVVAPYLYLNHRLLAAKKLKPDDVAVALAEYLRTREGVLQAYTYEGLKGGLVGDDAISRRVLRSFHPDRSGDVYIVLRPYSIIGSVVLGEAITTGTTHGSPHAYDTHVPLLVFGPGVAGGKRDEAVTPLHSAAIGAHFLGTKAPKDAEYGLPKTLLWK